MDFHAAKSALEHEELFPALEFTPADSSVTKELAAASGFKDIAGNKNEHSKKPTALATPYASVLKATKPKAPKSQGVRQGSTSQGIQMSVVPETPPPETPAGGTCESRCLESGASTDPSYVGHHTRTQGAPASVEAVRRGPARPMVSTGTQTSADDLRVPSGSPSTSGVVRQTPPPSTRKDVGVPTPSKEQGLATLAPPTALPPKGRGVTPRPSGTQRIPGLPTKPAASKGQPLATTTDEPMDQSGLKSDEDRSMSGSECSLPGTGGSTKGGRLAEGVEQEAGCGAADVVKAEELDPRHQAKAASHSRPANVPPELVTQSSIEDFEQGGLVAGRVVDSNDWRNGARSAKPPKNLQNLTKMRNATSSTKSPSDQRNSSKHWRRGTESSSLDKEVPKGSYSLEFDFRTTGRKTEGTLRDSQWESHAVDERYQTPIRKHKSTRRMMTGPQSGNEGTTMLGASIPHVPRFLVPSLSLVDLERIPTADSLFKGTLKFLAREATLIMNLLIGRHSRLVLVSLCPANCATALDVAGNYLNSLLDEARSPCDDFYEHVCGHWPNSDNDRKGEIGWAVTSNTLLQEALEASLVKALEDPMNRLTVGTAVDLFGTCMNRPSVHGSANAYARNLFANWIIKKWPVPTYRIDVNHEQVWRFAGQLVRDLGAGILASVSVAVDPVNDLRSVVCLDYPMPLYFLSDSMNIGFWQLLATIYQGNPNVTRNVRVLLLKPKFVEEYLPAAVNDIIPRNLMNYLGFRALILMAPFMPVSLQGLQRLFLLESSDRMEVPTAPKLCLRAVERAAPACLLKALVLPLQRSGVSLWHRHYLSQLGAAFRRSVPRAAWLDQPSILMITYRLKHTRVDAFYSIDLLQGNTSCATGYQSAAGLQAGPLYSHLLQMRQQEVLQELPGALGYRLAPALDTEPVFSVPEQVVRVPVGLINASVSANTTLFAFHLARVAVRLFAAMTHLLYESSVYEREIAFHFTDDSERQLEDLINCLLSDLRRLQKTLRRPNMGLIPGLSEPTLIGRWLLQQAGAVKQAFNAFRELLHVNRIWMVDFRYGNLRQLSASQLFFVYYALDQCEHSDAAFQRRQFNLRGQPSAATRVNLPLRHVPEFAEAFGCVYGDNLRAEAACHFRSR
ncbi:hypothetical protein HPB47_008512 [Ixodes persulcatus]|uniref:Uncharacterized protein n=1 Tax=Ixodes persulcatus TaxID=34615 RepID=A0AC60P4J3_IXOPE|nr:hypothetical protein HPB47_008512 [Ixodes persulcatus]